MTETSWRVVDVFAGAGGASLGIQRALGVSPIVAVNHAELAIRQHAANHPTTLHLKTDVWEVDPRRVAGGQEIDVLWLSPDCRFHSRCSGGRIRSNRVRSLPWVAVRWAASVSPARIVMECVPELARWGRLLPSGRPDPADAGNTFRRFVGRLRRCGYVVEWRVLNAADYGAPTTRRRLYLVATTINQGIVWPEPTHGGSTGRPWRTVATCLDWMDDPPSAIHRRKPLAPGTMARLAMGYVRHGMGAPRLVPEDAAGHPGICWIAKHYTGVAGHGVDQPLGTITCVDHHALCIADLVPDRGQPETAAEQWVRAGLQAWGDSQGILRPGTGDDLRVRIGKRVWRIVDLRTRMLRTGELAAAQGFPVSYRFTGNAGERGRGIGNSVVPQVAEALIAVNCGLRKTG